MKEFKFLLLVGAVVFFSACSTQQSSKEEIAVVDTLEESLLYEHIIKPKRALAPLAKLADLKQTEFAPTIENKVGENKNVIYAPALLYAWDTIKALLRHPIEVAKENSEDFKLINKSNSHLNSLTRDDYSIEVSVGDGIISKAYFQKSLPFEPSFQSLYKNISFSNQEVEGFGIRHFDDLVVKNIKILYYKDKDHFAIRIIPKDTAQELILCKGINLSGRLSDLINETKILINKGSKESKKPANSWKYTFTPVDQLAIPVINFNIEANYNQLEGQNFKCNNVSHMIQTAWQKTAFILDESGAEVKSIAIISVDSTAVRPEEEVVEKPEPKNFIFDKPFLLYIKRTDMTNPYFVMKVDNAELMNKK